MPDYIDTMAYAGQTPWHGLGTRLDADATSDVMRTAAGLNWEPTRAPLYVDGAPIASSSTPPTPWRVRVEGHDALVRSDDRENVLAIVGKRYTPFLNEDLFELGDALAGSGEARWHTAGATHRGRRVFGLIQCEGNLNVRLRDGSTDAVAPFLLLYNSHDGSSALRVRYTTVRVVCHNTATMALKGASAAEYKATHTASIGNGERVARDAREVLGLARESFAEQAAVAQSLADCAFNADDMRRLACQVLTGKDDAREAAAAVADSDGRQRSRYESQGGELMRLFARGRGNRGDTAWDAFNAVTEFVDHQRNRSAQWRTRQAALGIGAGFDSAVFGSGSKRKERALRLIVNR